ncbi:MAG: hypothetical protein A3J30_00120 [Candidatus Wildermuthbacteria bacterium RIFCSPLOWO2_02_FULL_47_9c]|uniref:Small-conductance mechanosensitive ion channel n=1 Tax=Candidatus Wildermuthbacteria bacterium RIFCSPLOWO2_02_FULL_47_9c TaxID=1802466 RepID=A0A1G2RUA0_9BACT|nr:MAG: hypothetical protein A3J30_00120 [Candidatus Wildermuthbacteria bacterium RIFCSPLOWO2_02_FULL_47_9c]
MNLVQITSSALSDAFRDLLSGVVSFVPLLIFAILVLLVGWFIAVGVGRLVADLLTRIKFNQVFERGNWKEALAKADLKVDPAGFIGGIFKWVLVIVFLLAAVEILGFEQFAGFLRDVLAYLPNVIVAALILVVAIIVADIAEKVVRASVEGAKIGHGQFISSVVKWFIWIFALFSALLQLDIAVLPVQVLIQTFVQGIGYGVALAVAIAFGLGGKDQAAEILRDLRNKMQR